MSLMACGFGSVPPTSAGAHDARWRAVSVALFAVALPRRRAPSPPARAAGARGRNGTGGGRRAWMRLGPHCLPSASPSRRGQLRYRTLVGTSVGMRGPFEPRDPARRTRLPRLEARVPGRPLHRPGPARLIPARARAVARRARRAGDRGDGVRAVAARSAAAFAALRFFILLFPRTRCSRATTSSERQVYLAAPALPLARPGVEWLRARRRRTQPPSPSCCRPARRDRRAQPRLPQRGHAWRANVRVAPHNVRAWNNLGWAWQIAGCWTQAEAAYGEALRLVPGHPGVRANLQALNAERAGAPFPPPCTAEP
jgi:hypothetical protein